MDEPDIRVLAQLHTACLADSFVTALGRGYVESFYRYVTRSDKEIALVERNSTGAIIGATVVSLEPSTFNRRLLRHTTLLRHVAMHAPRVLALLFAGPNGGAATSSKPHAGPPDAEMMLIFTAERERGRGVGDTLLRRAEHRLRELHVRSYEVRTVLDPANRAIAFYRERGFEPIGTDVRLGKRFQVFAKTLD